MPFPVSLDQIVGELEMLSDETAVFVNRKTGEVVSVFLPDLSIVEEGREGEEELEWGEDSLPILRSIAETDDWFALPDKFEIHEWEIMRRFADRPSHLAAEFQNATRRVSHVQRRRVSSRGSGRMVRIQAANTQANRRGSLRERGHTLSLTPPVVAAGEAAQATDDWRNDRQPSIG